jgi:hypothetical protein
MPKEVRSVTKVSGCLFVIAGAFAAGAEAHHSFPVHYVPEQTIKISGTVKEFRYRNPHAVVFVTVENDAGQEELWAVEWAGSGALRRRGILEDAIVAGDVVTIEGNPARDGSPAMRLDTVSFADDRPPLGPPVRGSASNED